MEDYRDEDNIWNEFVQTIELIRTPEGRKRQIFLHKIELYIYEQDYKLLKEILEMYKSDPIIYRQLYFTIDYPIPEYFKRFILDINYTDTSIIQMKEELRLTYLI